MLDENITQLKARGAYPRDYISAVGLVPVIKKLGKRLLGKNKKITGIEIGVCRGENVAYFLDNCDNIEKIYGIDPYMPYKDWDKEITEEEIVATKEIAIHNFGLYPGRAELLIHHAHTAKDWFKEFSVDYIFVDGQHTYDAAKQDLEDFYHKVRKGGIIAGHDWNIIGVQNAVIDFRVQHGIMADLKFVDNNVWYWEN